MAKKSFYKNYEIEIIAPNSEKLYSGLYRDLNKQEKKDFKKKFKKFDDLSNEIIDLKNKLAYIAEAKTLSFKLGDIEKQQALLEDFNNTSQQLKELDASHDAEEATEEIYKERLTLSIDPSHTAEILELASIYGYKIIHDLILEDIAEKDKKKD